MMNFSIYCSICLESFTSISDISTTPCGHVFHTGCITKWLNENSNCSHCRKPCKIQQIIKLYFSESPIVLEENITLNDLEQKRLKLEHEKLLMKTDWSKIEWNLKGLLNNANKQIKDLEKKVSEANGQIKDIEKEFNDRRKEFNEQKLAKLENERMKASLNNANKQIKDLEKEVNEANRQFKDLEKEFNDQRKKFNYQKMMNFEWSKTEWNLKGSLYNANKQIKDLEKEVNQANGKIKDLEKEVNLGNGKIKDLEIERNDRRKEFNDQKLTKLENERNLKKSIDEANKRIKDLEKKVNDIKKSAKIALDLKVGPAEHGVKRPCITPCHSKYLDPPPSQKRNKANEGIEDLDQNMVDKTKSGLESKAGGAVKRKCKDYPIDIKDEEENIENVIVDIYDIFHATLASLNHGIKSANVLYANCQDLLEYLSILSTLPKNANYEVHALKLDTWLTILQSMNINGYINQELTDNQVREMKVDFYNASNALKKFRNSKSKEKQHGC